VRRDGGVADGVPGVRDVQEGEVMTEAELRARVAELEAFALALAHRLVAVSEVLANLVNKAK
jgi:hypothetical protein